jgi:hypothetical protein
MQATGLKRAMPRLMADRALEAGLAGEPFDAGG